MKRVLRKEGRRTFDWRLEELGVGDQLVVPAEEASFNQVYNYVKPRSYALGINVLVERESDATLVTRTAARERADADPPQRPCPPGVPCDWGVIARTVSNPRWRWPYRFMEIGDQFRVAMEDMSTAELRQRAHREGWLRGKKFKVEPNPITAPGYNVVKCVIMPGVQHDVASYGVVKTHVLNCYRAKERRHMVDETGFDDRLQLDNVDDWSNMALGEVRVAEAMRVADPPRNSYIVEVKPFFEECARFAVDLLEDRVVIERVEMDMTHEKWLETKRQRVEEALS